MNYQENIIKSVSNKVSYSIKKELEYNEKYVKTKEKPYEGKIGTNFYDDEIPQGCFHCICPSVIMIDSVCEIGKSYYPQVLLEECKYIVKEREKSNYISHELEICSDDSDKESFDV